MDFLWTSQCFPELRAFQTQFSLRGTLENFASGALRSSRNTNTPRNIQRSNSTLDEWKSLSIRFFVSESRGYTTRTLRVLDLTCIHVWPKYKYIHHRVVFDEKSGLTIIEQTVGSIALRTFPSRSDFYFFLNEVHEKPSTIRLTSSSSYGVQKKNIFHKTVFVAFVYRAINTTTPFYLEMEKYWRNLFEILRRSVNREIILTMIFSR